MWVQCMFFFMTANEAITYVLGKFTMTLSYWRINYSVVKWPCSALCVNNNTHNVKWEIDSIWFPCYAGVNLKEKKKARYIQLHCTNTLEKGNLHYRVHRPFSRLPRSLLWVSLYLTHIHNKNPVLSFSKLTVSIGIECRLLCQYCCMSVF